MFPLTAQALLTKQYEELSEIWADMNYSSSVCMSVRNSALQIYIATKYKQNKLRGLSPQANYTDRATAAFRRS
jgi:hypothetical protein